MFFTKKAVVILLCLGWLNSVIGQDYDHTRLIVKLKDNVGFTRESLDNSHFGIQKIDDLNSRYALISIESLGPVNQSMTATATFLLKFREKISIADVIKEYEETELFEFVEPDFKGYGFDNFSKPIQPNDTYYKYQYHHNNNGTFNQVDNHPSKIGADIKSYLAWDITTGNQQVVLAIFDTGLKMDHTEIENRLWNNSKEKPNGMDDDGNGYVDDFHGWNFIEQNNDPTDDQGHGTAVTGIAMADADNHFGIAGMDWKCKTMVLKVLGNERAFFSSALSNAIYYAADNGAHIANMSLGSPGLSKAVEEAVNYALEKGMLIVAAMGNDGDNSNFYPAAFKNTLAVGATHPDDERVSKKNEDWGSNYGNHIDVVAPGSAILGMSHINSSTFNSLYSGTSMASPMVAGLACLLKGQDMKRSPQVIAGIIKKTAQDLTGNSEEDKAGWDPYYGYGRIDAYRAVTYPLKLYEKAETGEIFPNPANKDAAVVTLPLFTDLEEQYTLTITDSNGKILDKQIVFFNGLNVQITLAKKIGAGMYFFNFENDEDSFTKKIIFN